MQQVIIYQIPPPALLVGTEQSHIPVTLQRGVLGGNTYDGNGAQGAFPNNLPGVPAVPEPDFPPGGVRALRHRVPVQREPVGLNVYIPGAVIGVPGVVEGAQLRLVRGHRGQEVRLEGLFCELPDTM